MKRIIIFASGSGSNAQRIAEYFSATAHARVVAIYSNRADAYVLRRAEQMKIPAVVFDRSSFYETDLILRQLEEANPDLIVLAGFLWKVPKKIVDRFAQRIINIHPALLPRYGGKGMYGNHVHRAVIENKDKLSGITIHYVNENYDEGDVIFQASCVIESKDTPELLAAKIHELEHKYFPEIIEKILF